MKRDLTHLKEYASFKSENSLDKIIFKLELRLSSMRNKYIREMINVSNYNDEHLVSLRFKEELGIFETKMNSTIESVKSQTESDLDNDYHDEYIDSREIEKRADKLEDSFNKIMESLRVLCDYLGTIGFEYNNIKNLKI